MEELRLCESDYRFMCVIWDNAPLRSHELVELCAEQLGWKKSTTYTTPRKLCQRGCAENENSVVRALVPKSAVQSFESGRVVERTFDGSLPCFLAAFLGGRKISDAEAEELKRLIDEHKEG